MDEPTSALDEASARGIEDLVLGIIHERRMTCVIVTHDTRKPTCRRPHDVLEAGRLVTIGSTKGVLRAA